MIEWPIPDANSENEYKYFVPEYVPMDQDYLIMYNKLLGPNWTFNQMLKSVQINLPLHTEIIRTNPILSKYVSLHTGATLHITTPNGVILNNMLLQIPLYSPIITFRSLRTDYQPSLEVGKEYRTLDLWSTSYDPISSYVFALSDSLYIFFVLRCILPTGLYGSLLVEDNSLDTVKEQHEIVLASGIPFRVLDIRHREEYILDSKKQRIDFEIKIYTLQFLLA